MNKFSSIKFQDYLDSFKDSVIPLDQWPKKFSDLFPLVDNLVSKENNFLGLNKSIVIHNNTGSWNNFSKFYKRWPVCTIEQYAQFVNLYLEFLGIKDILKDYILISSFSFYANQNYEDISVDKDFICDFQVEILFSDQNLNYIKTDKYFNYDIFKEGELLGKEEVYLINRLRDFTDCFFYLFFIKFENDSSLMFADCLTMDYIKNIEKEVLEYLNIFYKERSKPMFSGFYSSPSSFYGKNYVSNNDFINGAYLKFQGEYSFKNKNNFFGYFLLWINFQIGWQRCLFDKSFLIDSQLKVDYIGNCKYIKEGLQ